MSAWAEVRQLAADLQRVQARSTSHHLSERNCVELISSLTGSGQLSVLHTQDGKEYVTPEQLEREARAELAGCRGRVNIVDLQQVLNVDLSHVEETVAGMLRHEKGLVLLRGELITRGYIHHLCDEINDTLQEVGQMSITDLSTSFGLPMDFILEHVESALGTRIKGRLDKVDSGVIYTEAYVARYRSRIRGLFSAVTRPTHVGPILARGGFQEKLFHLVLQELISIEQLAGSLYGRLDKAVYIPEVYTRMQNKWTDSFLASNGYLEYDALSRLGIDEPRAYVSKRYGGRERDEGGNGGVMPRDEGGSGGVMLLESCCVGGGVVAEVEGAVEELETEGWVDILPLLPSPCTDTDARLLLQRVCGQTTDVRVYGSIAMATAFLRSCVDFLRPSVKEKAQKIAASSPTLVAELAQQSSESEGGGGKEKKRRGGGGGRKGGRGKRSLEREEAKWELPFMNHKEIVEALAEQFQECPEDFLESIAGEIQRPLQELFEKEARACVSTLGQTPSAVEQRKRHADLQERVQGLWQSTGLFSKAIHLFDDDTAAQLSRYLLRSLCSELTNVVLVYLAEDGGQTTPTPAEFTVKERGRITSLLPDGPRRQLTGLNSLLNGTDVEGFLRRFEGVCGADFCGVMLRKPDRKKERQLLHSHRQALLESLRGEREPAMVLHLVVLLLFQRHTSHILHLTGRLVPPVVSFLAGHMSSADHAHLIHYQELVMQQLRAKAGPPQGAQSKGAEHDDGQSPELANKLPSLGGDGDGLSGGGDTAASLVASSEGEAVPSIPLLSDPLSGSEGKAVPSGPLPSDPMAESEEEVVPSGPLPSDPLSGSEGKAVPSGPLPSDPMAGSEEKALPNDPAVGNKGETVESGSGEKGGGVGSEGGVAEQLEALMAELKQLVVRTRTASDQ